MLNVKNPPDDNGAVWRFMVFLALIFLSQGLGGGGGVISQPLVYYLKEAVHWQPDEVTKFLSVLVIPWIIKPLYGLLSDYVPLFGLRRKPYLFIANALAVLAALWMTGLTSPSIIIAALFISAIGMAASSTITEAVLVENGTRWGMTGRFLNQQWLWINLASIIAALVGGWLAQSFAPAHAFHTAAFIAAAAPIGVLVTVWFLVDEQRSGPGVPTTLPESEVETESPSGDALGSVTHAFKSNVWIVGGFLFITTVIPSFGTPLFYHMVDDLKFDQRFIGILGAIGSVGSVVGALVYAKLAKRYNLAMLMYISIVASAIGTAAYLLLLGHISAIVLSFFNGIIGMVGLVASLTVAAHAVPQRSAGFAFAALMSVNNLAGQLASNFGAFLFVHAFHNQLSPLIWVSAIATGASLALVPLLKLGEDRGDSLRRAAPAVHPALAMEMRRSR